MGQGLVTKDTEKVRFLVPPLPQLLLVRFVLRPLKPLNLEAGPAGVKHYLQLGGTEATWTYWCLWDQMGWI